MRDRFQHSMPFGAELRPDGTVRFRLWAPSVEQVDLGLHHPAEVDRIDRHAMQRRDGGWFELITDAAHADTRYVFVLPDGMRVPDPASRFQPEDVQGSSMVIDPCTYTWRNTGWQGRPWEETVLYELHVGTFSTEGSFEGVRRRLDHLTDLGVTAVELMPLSDFPGRWNWGYDGVLPFAPDASYGQPEALKRLIDEAHERNLMVFVDVVYNHFGPEGNYLPLYAKDFFTSRHKTPWGDAINYDGPNNRPVRDFVIHNALYWLNEYRVDGLRFDAVHEIRDDSDTHILAELAQTVRHEIAQAEPDRHVHLVLENDANEARWLARDRENRPRFYEAQWNDDFHHVCHQIATGESGGYYADYGEDPVGKLGRALTQGFIYQGDPSPYRNGESRGEPSAHLPPDAFVNFLQNHDQIGNRAMGERISTLAKPRELRSLVATYLLSPSVPMLFMGEEWGSRRPFPFFCDFGPDLAEAVRQGRRNEFAKFPEFAAPEARERIPDPVAEETFRAAQMTWEALSLDANEDWLAYYTTLLRLRHEEIIPRLTGMTSGAEYSAVNRQGMVVRWTLGDGSRLVLAANFGDDAVKGFAPAAGELLFESDAGGADRLSEGVLPGWTAVWFLEESSSA